MNIFNSLHICHDNYPFQATICQNHFCGIQTRHCSLFRASTLVAEWQYLTIITYVHNFEVVRLMRDVFFSYLVHSQLLGAHSCDHIYTNSTGCQDAKADQQGNTCMHTNVHPIMDIDTFLSKDSYKACCKKHHTENCIGYTSHG